MPFSHTFQVFLNHFSRKSQFKPYEIKQKYNKKTDYANFYAILLQSHRRNGFFYENLTKKRLFIER